MFQQLEPDSKFLFFFLRRFFRYDVLSEAMRSGQRKEIRERFIRLFNELKETPLGR